MHLRHAVVQEGLTRFRHWDAQPRMHVAAM